MLATSLITVFVFAVLMGLMAIGVIVQGKRLAGSCGGDPDSAHCGCSPEKKAACSAKKHTKAGEDLASAMAMTPATDERLFQVKPARRS